VEFPVTLTGMTHRCPWLWDVDLDSASFEALLAGGSGSLPHDRRWALLRLVEYAPYAEIRRLLPLDYFLEAWPSLAPRMRSQTRRQGMEFYYEWNQQRADSHA
jgi:hypothetical protein